ncbi:MAG: hypothetical protein LBT55_07120 [Clostridiaceae bacterium]|jgi:hypothetical protein|nr:hypothetical protein [Clostridiaceae bacterium]
MAKAKRSRQQTSSAFGWIFQSSAGLYLLLDCIEKATSIKMEGKKEDVEITLNDDTIIYAQAKSVENINDTANNRAKLKKALLSLSECTESVAKLIYISNIINPLDSDTEQQYIYSRTPFSAFRQPDQKMITDLLAEIDGGANFQTAKFELVTFKFIGDDDSQRYGEVLNKTREFLVRAHVSEGKAQAILTEWKALLMNNNAQRARMTKGDILFPLILVTIEHQDLEAKYNEVCELGIYDETMHRYSDFIHNAPRKTEFFMQVCGHYQKTYAAGDHINDFVKDKWKDYIEEFSVIEKSEDFLESLIKLLLLATLLKRTAINNIKTAANLEVKS